MIIQIGRSFMQGQHVVMLQCTGCNWRAIVYADLCVTEDLLRAYLVDNANAHVCWDDKGDIF